MSKKLLSNAAVSALALAIGAAPVQAGQGPSSSQSPYVVPVLPSVDTTSIFTVGDSIGGYQMLGIPDGLGAYDNGDGTFTLLMNHELGATVGTIVRDHGQIGSFASKWTIDASNLAVLDGDDLIQNVNLTDPQTGDSEALGRLCSADLPDPLAFYNPDSGLGTQERIFMHGEEVGPQGRAFGSIVTGAAAGESYQLDRLGRFSWENAVAAPGSGDTTVVMGLDDSTPGQVYMYVGQKTDSGSDIDRAGLTNGELYGIRIPGVPDESRATGIGAGIGVPVVLEVFNKGNVSGQSGATIQADSEANNVTEWLRPEDGAWDPNNPNDFYFVTTDRFNNPSPNEGRSRLWKISLDDVSDPTLGGDVTMLLDGTEGQQMFDNIAIDQFGNILIQEDPGNNNHLAKVWAYSTTADKLVLLAQHDPNRFDPNVTPTPLTRDEESSGIIDATAIFDPYGLSGLAYALFDVQAHYNNGTTLVEGGQLLVMSYDPSQVPEPGTVLLLGAGIGGLALRRRKR